MNQARQWRKSSTLLASKDDPHEAVVRADEHWQRGQVLAEVASGAADPEKSIAKAKKNLAASIEGFLTCQKQRGNHLWGGDSKEYSDSRLESFERWARSAIKAPVPVSNPPRGTIEDLYSKPEIEELLKLGEQRMFEATDFISLLSSGRTIAAAVRLYKIHYLDQGEEDLELAGRVFGLFSTYLHFKKEVEKFMRQWHAENSKQEKAEQITLF